MQIREMLANMDARNEGIPFDSGMLSENLTLTGVVRSRILGSLFLKYLSFLSL